MQYRLRPDMGFFPHVDLAELQAANLTPTTIQSLRSSGCAITPTTSASTRGPSWPAVRRPAAPWRGTSRGCRAAGCARNPPASRLSVAGAPFEVTADAGEPLAAASSGDRPVIAFHGTADGIVGFELADGPCAAPGPPRSRTGWSSRRAQRGAVRRRRRLVALPHGVTSDHVPGPTSEATGGPPPLSTSRVVSTSSDKW